MSHLGSVGIAGVDEDAPRLSHFAFALFCSAACFSALPMLWRRRSARRITRAARSSSLSRSLWGRPRPAPQRSRSAPVVEFQHIRDQPNIITPPMAPRQFHAGRTGLTENRSFPPQAGQDRFSPCGSVSARQLSRPRRPWRCARGLCAVDIVPHGAHRHAPKISDDVRTRMADSLQSSLP